MSQYGGHAPQYPQQGQGASPYPQQGQGSTPYPQQGQGSNPSQQQGQGSNPYPQQGQGSNPYPQQGQGSNPSQQQGQGSNPYPQQGQGSSPYPQQGQGSTPYQQQGQGSNPSQQQSQGSNPYPQQGQGSSPYPQQGQGSSPYPQQGQGSTPYQQQGQGSNPYPQQGQGSNPYPQQGQGSTPYPQQGQGSTQYSQQGQGSNFPQLHKPGESPYPGHQNASAPPPPNAPPPRPTTGPGQGQGQPPYIGQGQAPQQGQGQAPYPGQQQQQQQQHSSSAPPPPRPSAGPGQGHGQAPYPGQGQAPYPGQGQAPYQGQGHAQSQGQAPYPGQGHAPPQGQAPYSGQGQAPYPGQGQGHQYPNQGYAGQGHAPPQGHHSPYPGQQQGHGGPPVVSGQGLKVDEYKSRVEIRLECKNLLDMDVMSKSDPCAVLYMKQGGNWVEVGRTENVKNCLNPKFAKSFITNYFFEEVQKVLICVYDLDNSTPQLSDDDFLGQLETTLGQLVSNTPMTAPLVLRNGRRAGNGTITVRTEELKKDDECLMMTFRAAKLDNKDFFGKSDPYLEFSKATPEGTWQVVHRTEIIKNNLNPSWRPFELTSQTLCSGNKKQNIKVDCFDWDSDGSHDLIGGFVTTLEEIMKAQNQEVMWPCINQAKKAKKKSYSNSGCIYLSKCQITTVYSFLDFITGGTQINFTVGIDFTASNGNPATPNSLHYINPHQPNEYMSAIRAVGDVCQDYDTDKLFPVLGFGAKIPPQMQVSHQFAVNFNPQNPYCSGIDGVLQAYYNCIQQVQLYGPTNASPIINHVAQFASQAQNEEMQKGAHAYFILLLLTDGVLSDMSDTKRAIVAASKLPMSLIIVGVGGANFDDMEELDGDEGVLRSPSGEAVKRDIVQFVPFRQFRNTTSIELARHVLAEVPKQVTDYYKMRRMGPVKKATQ